LKRLLVASLIQHVHPGGSTKSSLSVALPGVLRTLLALPETLTLSQVSALDRTEGYNLPDKLISLLFKLVALKSFNHPSPFKSPPSPHTHTLSFSLFFPPTLLVLHDLSL
ncbi:mCG144982, partial [Mus musculus]